MKKEFITMATCLLGLVSPMCGQEKVEIQRLSSEVNFDGKVDEQAWDALPG